MHFRLLHMTPSYLGDGKRVANDVNNRATKSALHAIFKPGSTTPKKQEDTATAVKCAIFVQGVKGLDGTGRKVPLVLSTEEERREKKQENKPYDKFKGFNDHHETRLTCRATRKWKKNAQVL